MAKIDESSFASFCLDHEPKSYSTLDQNRFYENDNCVFDIAIADQERPIFDKISSVSEQLGSFSEILTGTPAIEYFYEWGDLLVTEDDLKSDSVALPFINVSNVDRYAVSWGKEVRAAKKKLSKPYLLFHPRYVGRNKWSVFSIRPKIVIAGTAKRLTAALDKTGYANLSLYAVVRWQDNKSFHINYLLGLLNSRLIDYWFEKKFGSSGISGGYLTFNAVYLSQIPICAPKHADNSWTARHNEIVALVDQMLHLHHQFANASPTTKRSIEEQIKGLDAEIGTQVFRIYGLKNEEIETVNKSYR